MKKNKEIVFFLLLHSAVLGYSDPDFLIIGAMRSGTTSLYNYLVQHPNVLPALNVNPKNNEIKNEKGLSHFFVTDFDRGIDFYRNQFPSKSADKITGEKAPMYLFFPGVAERVRQSYPNIKLLVILRNPIDRMFSNYRRYGTKTFEKFLRQKNTEGLGSKLRRDDIKWVKKKISNLRISSKGRMQNIFLEFGKYAEQLERWLKVFDRSQFLILIFEEFVADPEYHMNKVFEFLELPKYKLRRYTKSNASSVRVEMKEETRRYLGKYFKPQNKRLERLFNRKLPWN